VGGGRPFRFGVVSARAESGDEWIERARRVESLGYSTLVMPDGLGPTLTPIPALGVLAGATRTLRLGTFVLHNDLRNPVLLAREIATLDLLSGGRVEIGLGAGRPDAVNDNRKLGIPFGSPGERVSRLAESVAILKALLAGETVDAPGPYYAAAGADLFPKPVQRPRPPIMIAAGQPRLLGIAAREADIVTIAAPPASNAYERAVERLREAAPERFDRLELCLNLLAAGAGLHPIAARGGLQLDDLVRSGSPAVLTGSPDEMAEQLRRTRDRLGFSYVILWEGWAESFAPVVERLAGA
jgi:probable F420-dependent oxidoreductase